jgi:hypothetical protein
MLVEFPVAPREESVDFSPQQQLKDARKPLARKIRYLLEFSLLP